MIQVCDAIMGTGKSQSAISYMNHHKEDKFIYITPYLEEASRIQEGCPELHFIAPSHAFDEFKHRKSLHTEALIKEGRNITTTHQAFVGYTNDMLEDIRRLGYTLIIDENLNVLEKAECSVDDLQMLVDSGYAKDVDGVFSLTEKEYNGKLFASVYKLLKSRELIKIVNGRTDHLFYWILPPELITSFKNVFILTYLFEGQSLHHFLEINHLPYEYIGIEKTDEEETGFRFSEYPGYTPEYVSKLKDMLHILDNEKLNSVGDDYYALSMNWFEKNPEGVGQLKKNTYNCFRNIWSDTPSSKRLWATYNKDKGAMRGKGYTNSFLTFNAKATNRFRDKTRLVYMVNLFMNANDKLFYRKFGLEADDDLFALSIMVQWIWRSALRDGEEVYLYIPSSRMRNILINWIDSVSKGGNVIA